MSFNLRAPGCRLLGRKVLVLKNIEPETYEGRFELSARVWDSASQWYL